MHYVSVHDGISERWGIFSGDSALLAPRSRGWSATLLDFIRADTETRQWQTEQLQAGHGEDWRKEDIQLVAPLPRPPRNVMCLGLNYADHAAESQRAKGQELQRPDHPVVFTKATSSVTGPYTDIPLDTTLTTQLDWEVELGVVIGRGGRNIPEEQALEHVFGYTVVNDLSARDLQFRHKQFFLGKSLDGSCPMGPVIADRHAIADPHDLTLWCDVNGERQQSGTTADQLFRIPEAIAILSRVMTLEPGDIIATGTPSGVGFAQEPPRFLQPGDTVECGIQGIGVIRNRIVPATAPAA
ncbi:fumarylacetoacetate hydrolase family protein [Aquisalimonas asiatica]|uniref:2-keto-4-pentenoate hydratase/2-oxohepta-3-ene-1,7-dioic acid hydratase (Catechol pathway) n=1 Tax=Aquisalimonas asiatica TaxID=406100 RepID=A0A1H8QH79_9GAMM|nr:fumarylacetoacetate hydrolase family protein [Aquisalimonas asiatica]SEO53267.1 2-keto-4-pentenoate hydratase/2-oxohepta-3-ene-1,7-dioic acid hydratase (catechol pathway) [Aquisalimonas asiatica]